MVVCQRFFNGRKKIKKRSFCYKNIVYYSEIEDVKIRKLYDDCEPLGKKEHWHRLVFHTNTKYINYEMFLNRSIHYDFGLGGLNFIL